jgi:hypothetical protein
LRPRRWTIPGFISHHVARAILGWAKVGSRLARRNLVNLLRIPLTGGIAGTWFETWVFDTLVKRKPLRLNNGRKLACQIVEGFEAAEMPVKLTEDTLYRANTTMPHSIDAYGLVQDTLLMVQITVPPCHDAALWTSVQPIEHAAQ